MRQKNAAFANFICKFDDKNLLDYAKEIVIPAFTRDTYVRSFGERTHYHFYEVELLNLAEDANASVWVLAGRFIKDTELRREQIFDEEKGLIKDEQSMRSAPSAFFVLILNNHRLIYFPETSHAPDLKSFKATAQSFLNQRHKEFINELYNKHRKDGKKITKKALTQAHPWPHLEVIPLAGKSDIKSFIERFEKLKKIEFHVVRPNDDINAGEILNEVRLLSNSLKSKSTKLTTSSTDGLDQSAAIDAVTEATATGNQDVTVSGFDASGNRLVGNNEAFKLSAELDHVPPTKKGLIKSLVGLFSAMRTNNALAAPAADQFNDKLNELSEIN